VGPTKSNEPHNIMIIMVGVSCEAVNLNYFSLVKMIKQIPGFH
jgi:hypothetical protein